MGNISNRLKGLFNEYLVRIEEEKHHVTVKTYDYHNRTIHNGDDEDYNGIIYFYEWSDISRTPKSYYTLKAFENFLASSKIYIASYEKELIKHIHYCYIACSKDGKKLLIKCSYESLKRTLESEKSSLNSLCPSARGSEDKEPYHIAITHAPSVAPKSFIQRPPMYEPSGRWDSREEMQDSLGGMWGW